MANSETLETYNYEISEALDKMDRAKERGNYHDYFKNAEDCFLKTKEALSYLVSIEQWTGEDGVEGYISGANVVLQEIIEVNELSNAGFDIYIFYFDLVLRTFSDLKRAWDSYYSNDFMDARKIFENLSENFQEIYNFPENFEDKKNFEDKLFIDYTNQLSYFTKAKSKEQKFDYADAINSYEVSEDILNDLLTELQNNKGKNRGEFVENLNDQLLLRQFLSRLDHLNAHRAHHLYSGEFEEACHMSNKILKEFQKKCEYIKGLDIQTSKYLFGKYYEEVGNKYNFIAECLRANNRYDEAIQMYNKINDEWRKAKRFYVQSKLGIQDQESLNNVYNQSIRSSRLRCELEKVNYESLIKKINALKDENEKLEKDLKSLYETLNKSTNISIQNHNQAEAVAENNITLITKIENNAREQLTELINGINSLPPDSMDNETLKEIKDEAEEIVNSDEHGQGFFGKVKNFSKKLKNNIKEFGEISGPILPIVQTIISLSLLIP